MTVDTEFSNIPDYAKEEGTPNPAYGKFCMEELALFDNALVEGRERDPRFDKLVYETRARIAYPILSANQINQVILPEIQSEKGEADRFKALARIEIGGIYDLNEGRPFREYVDFLRERDGLLSEGKTVYELFYSFQTLLADKLDGVDLPDVENASFRDEIYKGLIPSDKKEVVFLDNHFVLLRHCLWLEGLERKKETSSALDEFRSRNDEQESDEDSSYDVILAEHPPLADVKGFANEVSEYFQGRVERVFA